MSFSVWFISKMHNLGYQKSHMHKDADLTIWFNFTNGNEDFNVCYVMKPIEPDLIRDLFEHNSDRPILFIVDEKTIRGIDATSVPLWLKALHAIYYGRVYVYLSDDNSISAVHFDWNKREVHYAHYIDIDGILFTDTDCKLKDFLGIFHIARFYDKAFWTEKVNSKQSAKDRKWDDFEKRQQRKTDEDIYEAFKRAFREHMRNHNACHDYEPVQPRYAPKGDKWLDLFIGTGSIEAARVKYRELAKQLHPDLNPGSSEALSTMQAINIAFDKVKEYWK